MDLPSEKKKKRRRSSLAPARVVPELAQSPVSGLCSQIDGSLPPEERLNQLTLLCLQSALDKVSQDSDPSELNGNLENAKEEIVKKLQESEVYREAVKEACRPPDKLLPNPENIELDDMVKRIEHKINRLKKEEEDWNNFLQGLNHQTEQLESYVKSGHVLTPSELTDDQRTLANKYLSDLPVIDEMRKQKEEALQKIYILAAEHQRNIHRLEMQQEQVNKQLDRALNQLNERTFPQIDSPKDSVQKLSEFPSTLAEPQ